MSQLQQKKWGDAVFQAAVILLLVLSNVFSSRIQETLPVFSRLMRLGLTGGAVVLLLGKIFLLTDFTRRQRLFALALIAYTGLQSIYSDDVWFVLAALLGLGAAGADLKKAMRVYLVTAAAALLAVFLLHYTTDLVPYWDLNRAYDFGYGHYNGFGGRLLGVYFAWAWLRWGKYRWFDYMGMAAYLVLTQYFVSSRGAVMSMAVLLVLLLAHRLVPRLFQTKVFGGLAVSCHLLALALSLGVSYFCPVEANDWSNTTVWEKLNVLSSMRLSIWHTYFWGADFSLLGGLPTDTGGTSCIDNAYLAIPMNKGILGAVVVAVLTLWLMYRLWQAKRTRDLLCMIALFAYLLMENKPFLFSTNPFLLLLPAIFALPSAETREPS